MYSSVIALKQTQSTGDQVIFNVLITVIALKQTQSTGDHVIFNVLITVIALKQTQSTGDQVFNYLSPPPPLQNKSVLNCFNFEDYSMFIQLLNNSKITPDLICTSREKWNKQKSFNFRICQHGQYTYLTFVDFFHFQLSNFFLFAFKTHVYIYSWWGCHGRDHNVVGAYHHVCCEFESLSGRGIQNYLIKFCQWLVIGQWFFPGPPISSTNETDCHDITKILLKVALNTIKQTIYSW